MPKDDTEFSMVTKAKSVVSVGSVSDGWWFRVEDSWGYGAAFLLDREEMLDLAKVLVDMTFGREALKDD
jgi:hypothetical protein